MRITQSPEQDYNPTWAATGAGWCSISRGASARVCGWSSGATGEWGDPAPLPVADRAARPRWSPDGRWISYISPEGIKVLEPAPGRARLLLAPMRDDRFPSTWSGMV